MMLFVRFPYSKFPLDLSALKHFFQQHVPLFCYFFVLKTVDNNKNKKSVKLSGDMLNFSGFIQIFVFSITNHYLKDIK